MRTGHSTDLSNILHCRPSSTNNSLGCLCIAQKRCQPRGNLGLDPIGMHLARNANLGLRALRLPFRESALLVPFGGHGRMSLHCFPVLPQRSSTKAVRICNMADSRPFRKSLQGGKFLKAVISKLSERVHAT